MTASWLKDLLDRQAARKKRIKTCRAANELALEILMPDFMLEQLLEESGGEIRLKEWSRLFKVSQPMLAWRLGIPGYFYEEYE
jgi:Zn-dependent peptidase ImmA (M78 family)